MDFIGIAFSNLISTSLPLAERKNTYPPVLPRYSTTALRKKFLVSPSAEERRVIFFAFIF